MEYSRGPIIVCGAPRSGTRMTARILNVHPRVAITNEFPTECTAAAFDLLSTVENYMSAWPDRAEIVGWQSARATMMTDIWLNASSSYVRNKAKGAERIANKTPENERFFADFERLFTAHKPQYLFCVRHPERVLRSLKNMPWNSRSVRQNWKLWKASISTLLEMERSAGDRVFRVQVDRLEDADIAGLGERIFKFLGLGLDDAARQRFAGLGPAQPLTDIMSDNIVELTDKERRAIKREHHYTRFLEILGYE